MLNRRQLIIAGAAILAGCSSNRGTTTTVPMAEFRKALEEASLKDGGRIVIFEIGASWCPGCIALTPMMNKLLSEYRDRASIDWIRTDIGTWESSKQFRREWGGVESIPYMGAYYKGRRVTGSLLNEDRINESRLRKWLDTIIAKISEAPPQPQKSPPQPEKWQKKLIPA